MPDSTFTTSQEWLRLVTRFVRREDGWNQLAAHNLECDELLRVAAHDALHADANGTVAAEHRHSADDLDLSVTTVMRARLVLTNLGFESLDAAGPFQNAPVRRLQLPTA